MKADAWSKTSGGAPSRGNPKAIGLVPKKGRVPPAGATIGAAAVKAMPTSPSSVSISISGQSAA